MTRKAKITELEAQLKKFEGIDPEAVKKLLTEKTEAERTAAEKRGEFDRVKQMMADEHAKEVKKIKDDLEAERAAKASLLDNIGELTIGQAFSTSEFVTKDLVLPPSKARQVYGANFELDGTTIVAYDRPKGAGERTKLVDASGKPLPFDEAIKRIVSADPDHKQILKSKMAPGAGSGSGTRAPAGGQQQEPGKGVARIEAALAARAAKK